MSTATSSVTTADPSWSTPAVQPAAQQWQSQEQYQQYYNYYQTMNQTSMATSTSAAVGSSTTTTDPSAAYTQDYSKAWDEYYKAYYGQSYAASASAAQYPSTTYSYDQYGYPNLAAPPPAYQYESVTASAAYPYTQSSTVAATNPSYSYSDPSYTAPTVSAWSEGQSSFEKSAVYNSSYSSSQQTTSYEKPYNSYDQGNSYSNGTSKSNVESESYLERFPPPPFDSGTKYGSGNRVNNYRGRGSNKDDNFRRPPRGQSNRGSSQRGNFNDRSQYDERSQSNRSQYNNYDQSQYGSNNYQSNGLSFRGRGGGTSYRGRGGEQPPRGRGSAPARGRGGGGAYEPNNKRFASGEYKQGYNNNYDEQSWDTRDNFNQNDSWNNEYDTTNDSPWNVDEGTILPGWSSQRKRPTMDCSSQDPIRPMPLMDIVVQPTVQSAIVVRRQALIDQWQNAVRKMADNNEPIQYHWATVKSALSIDTQPLLSPSFVKGDGIVHCEVHLDDIYLVQSTGSAEDAAIEEAGKLLYKMLQDRLYVRTATRLWASDIVPVFCVSRSANGPVTVPPIINNATVLAATRDVVKPAPLVGANDQYKPGQQMTSQNNKPSQIPQSVVSTTPHKYCDTDIFLVLETTTSSEKDQSITILTNTAKFNKINIEYKHEKPENATHISQCIVTINGQLFETGEARDYLVAKREAADKAVTIFKLSCPQVTLGFDRLTELAKSDIVQSGKSIEESFCDWLKKFSSGDDDTIYRFGQSFTNQERDTIGKMAANLNISTKVDGTSALLLFRQYPVDEMKKRLLKHGYCAQYRLIVDGSTDDNKSM